MEHELKLFKTCPMCGIAHTLTMNDKMAMQFHLYQQGVGFIQDTLSDFNASEREFIKTGFCIKCQKMLFDEIPSSELIAEV